MNSFCELCELYVGALDREGLSLPTSIKYFKSFFAEPFPFHRAYLAV